MPVYDVYFAVLESDELEGESTRMEAESLPKAEERAAEEIHDRAAGRPYLFSVGEEGSIRSGRNLGADLIRRI